jgi:NitT/TauT family transport system ATP-binding protein
MSLLSEAAPATAATVSAGESADYAIDCRNASVRFVTERRVVTAFDNVSFTVGRGGFLSVLGPSGCGKSTLLRVVADLIDPSKGSVKLFGGQRFTNAARIDETRRPGGLGKLVAT